MAQLAENVKVRRKSDFFVAVSLVLLVMMLVIPLPTVILDLLMIVNITLSLLVVLIVLYTKNPLDFSVFPTLLLTSTVFSLALNVSSTRLILAMGEEFQGKIVRSFGRFVVGGSGAEGLVIGLIIFIILVAVQFIVITKGSTRVAEVAARFTLDSLPGKQMAIEAEFNSGALGEEQMAKKKTELEREVDFYGAMDGASKFVSGNVKVGILITLVNIIGGLIVGTTIHGESLGAAVNTYISLTVGDGLVTQIPSLLISTATGLIVTRSISEGTFGSDISTQFSREYRIYGVASAFLAFLAFLPGFPWYILLPLSALTGVFSWRLRKTEKQENEAEKKEQSPRPEVSESPKISLLDPLSLEIGYALVPLVDQGKGAELLDRITNVRREVALELGLIIPRIRIVDNMRLQPSEYAVKIRGVEIGKGTLRINRYLAISPGRVSTEIEGEATTEPTFGLPALWISEENRKKAERAGYTVVDTASVITTHLTEIVKTHAAEIFGRQEVRGMIDTMKDNYSAVVEDVQKNLSLGEIHKVLQRLLSERISIRNLVTILETLADYAILSKETFFLVEKVRQALGRQICAQYADSKKTLWVFTLDPAMEQTIVNSKIDTPTGPMPALSSSVTRSLLECITRAAKELQSKGHVPVLLCSESARPLMRILIPAPEIAILSSAEITSGVMVEVLAVARMEEEKVA